ncbi:MAG: right-handed parallel beta-helix repeat-containing protein [Gammaproteobacteria bacterium]|nr:right-handed parallel beta-helix repeat-containing protein [Gammaproteobacteria bacterium]MDH5801610.1 right-handed parallel beta-helix repeat-containing protein [Gammaproteobacteria bacterium]
MLFSKYSSIRHYVVCSVIFLLYATLPACSSDSSDKGPPPQGSEFPAAFDESVSYSNTIYVSAAASPGGDGSQLLPYDTIRDGLLNAAPGTQVRIAAGTYGGAGAFSDVQGMATAPIAIVADGQVIIDGGDAEMAFYFSDARYLVFDGLTIQNTSPHGINMDDGGSYDTPSEFIVFRNMNFRNIGATGQNRDCLKLSGVNNFYIEMSRFENCRDGEAIDMVGSHDGIITENYFANMGINGINTKGGTANIHIHGNQFVDIPQRSINAGGSSNIAVFRPIDAEYEGSQIHITANIFVRPGSTPVAFVGCDTCVFANNTIIEPQNYIARILEENTQKTAGHSGYFINNIIVFNSSQISPIYVGVGSNTTPATYTFGWNLWYSLDNNQFAGPTYGDSIIETSSVIQQDPNLDANYRTQAGSPAFGQGTTVIRGLIGDYDRNAYANPPSIGAFSQP